MKVAALGLVFALCAVAVLVGGLSLVEWVVHRFGVDAVVRAAGAVVGFGVLWFWGCQFAYSWLEERRCGR